MSKGDLAEAAESLGDQRLKDLNLGLRRLLKGHFGKVYGSAWAADSTTVLSAAQDGNLLLWNAMTGMKTCAISLQSAWVLCCDITGPATFCASGGLDNSCTVHSLSQVPDSPLVSSKEVCELAGHDGYLSACRFNPTDETKIVTTSGDGTVVYWDVNRKAKQATYSEHKQDVTSMDWVGQAGTCFLTGGCDHAVRLWDVRAAASQHVFAGHGSDVNGVCCFHNQTTFASCGDDGVAILWDLRSPDRQLATFRHDSILRGATSLSASLTGRFLVVAYDDGMVRVWDSLHENLLQELATEDPQRISTVRISPDGQALVAGSWDSQLRVYA